MEQEGQIQKAWEATCQGCGRHVVLYERVEFVCGRCRGEIVPGDPLPTALSRTVADDDPLGQLLWHLDWCIHQWEKFGEPEDFDPLENYRGLRAIADDAAKRRGRRDG